MTLATTLGAAFVLIVIGNVAASPNPGRTGCGVQCASTQNQQPAARGLTPVQPAASYLYDTCHANKLQSTGSSTGKKTVADHASWNRLCPIAEVCTWNATQFPRIIIHHVCANSRGFVGNQSYMCVNQTRFIHVLEQTQLPCRNDSVDSESPRWNQVKVYVGCAAKIQKKQT